MPSAPPINLTLYAIPAFVLLMAVEVLYLVRHRESGLLGYSLRDSAASLTMGLGYSAIGLLWKGVEFALYLALYELTPLRMGTGALAWVLLIVGDDFCYYWFHRIHHESRVFWASHVVHHSSERYNLSTALRQTWTPMTSSLFWAPLALLGFHPVMIVLQQAISLLYQFWIHTEAVGRLGPLEWVLNTPSHHRVHHGSNPRYLDRNYAGIFIVWDRLFGTFQAEDERPVYGLTHNIRTYNPVRIAFHEFAAILRDVRRGASWRVRLGHVFRGPGWTPSPDDTRAPPTSRPDCGPGPAC
ncbi:sterol desaturase family protein [[Archangium] primigenium]|uniref:sterol desaturase family protein n=1 Tax=Melittangium TaxID=44 RepID=UPI00195C8D20|nr:sterol desaturase family protein [Archangium primigenium]MBM7115679.1 sterol desaturase family protein [Archangium primigenium]